MSTVQLPTNKRIVKSAEIVWQYMKMNQALRPANVMMVLGNRDERVANYAAELYERNMSNLILVSGGIAHHDDLLKTSWGAKTEAEYFAAILVGRGVPLNSIIMETKATNTGENIKFSYELLAKKKIYPKSLLLVQKPYMERRTFAAFMKQWPGDKNNVAVSSPPYGLLEYLNADQPFEIVVNIMVGDLQRIIEYPKLGYQIYQKVPQKVLNAYNYLADNNYNKHLIQR